MTDQLIEWRDTFESNLMTPILYSILWTIAGYYRPLLNDDRDWYCIDYWPVTWNDWPIAAIQLWRWLIVLTGYLMIPEREASTVLTVLLFAVVIVSRHCLVDLTGGLIRIFVIYYLLFIVTGEKLLLTKLITDIRWWCLWPYIIWFWYPFVTLYWYCYYYSIDSILVTWLMLFLITVVMTRIIPVTDLLLILVFIIVITEQYWLTNYIRQCDVDIVWWPKFNYASILTIVIIYFIGNVFSARTYSGDLLLCGLIDTTFFLLLLSWWQWPDGVKHYWWMTGYWRGITTYIHGNDSYWPKLFNDPMTVTIVLLCVGLLKGIEFHSM